MKPLKLYLLIVFPISIVVTVVLFFASAFYGGACHCMTLVSALFPYDTYLTMATSWEATAFFIMIFQFPVYGLIVTLVNNRRGRLLTAAAILIVHSIAAAVVVKMYP